MHKLSLSLSVIILMEAKVSKHLGTMPMDGSLLGRWACEALLQDAVEVTVRQPLCSADQIAAE